MVDLDVFLDEIYKDYEQYAGRIEKDQELPPKEALSEVLHVLLNVSCLSEEGRYSAFRACFIPPDSDYLDAYIYATVFPFSEPVEFNTRKLHKLTPALNEDISYLMLDVAQRPFQITGILAAHTSLLDTIMNLSPGGTRMPKVPNILVKEPGRLEFCFGEIPLVCYYCGEIIRYRRDVFSKFLVADKLRMGSNLKETERLLVLYKIMRLIHSYRHGGQLFIVPNDRPLADVVTLKYKLPMQMHRKDRFQHLGSAIARKKYLSTYADIVARLSCVDGGVVLNKDLDLIGFGGQAIADLTNINSIKMRFVASDGHIETHKRFNDNGMRHRACYSFCGMVEDSVAIVFSQDGSIEACTQDEGQVVVYENVAIPTD